MGENMTRHFACCEHCADDPIFHEDNPPDTHEASCSICDDPGLIAWARVEAAEAEVAELRAEAERWREKAQESGAAYANANSKHHAELDRANRLERLADTLAGKAVDLEDRARTAEAESAKLADKVARVEAIVTGKAGGFAQSIRAALAD